MDFKEHLKNSVDIVKVVGEYVRLRKAGASRFVGLCPFHTERTPSFGVNAAQQFFKCFGCGEGGDVFSFIQKIEGVTFFEALKLLAERNGIPLPKRAEYTDPETKVRAAVYRMHEIAFEHFSSLLHSSAGAEARAYLETRGVSRDSIDEFGLGYADRSSRSLMRRFEADGFTPEQAETAGLAVRREDGSLYERFRHRLMFPIHNETGKVIAFGGRALDPEDRAKYLNSPETPIYHKSSVLYNLHRARLDIRKEDRAVLVEGYMDVIGVAAAGVRCAVAPCGTSLTAEQIRALRRHSGYVIVNFDADSAGASAAERSIHLLLDEGMHIRVVELDRGLDPDEFCKMHGAAAYRERLDAARGYFHWMGDRARSKFDMRSAEGRVAAFQFLLPVVQKLPDRIERLATVNDLASYLNVEPGAVLDNFRRTATDRTGKTLSRAVETVSPVEKILLNLFLANEQARREIIPELRNLPALEQFPTRRIFQALFTVYDSQGDVSFADVHARLDPPEQTLLCSAVLADETDGSVLTIEQGMACIHELEKVNQRTQRAALKARVKDAERAGNLAEAMRLAEELGRLERT
jgi:DNA primase